MFEYEKTATIPISQFRRTPKETPQYNPFADYINQFQNHSTVTNQSNRSNNPTFLPIINSTSVPALRRPPMTPFSIVDAYSMSSTNNNPFQTNTSLNATATSSQTSHKPHTDPKTSPSASLPSSSVVFTKQATNKCPVTA